MVEQNCLGKKVSSEISGALLWKHDPYELIYLSWQDVMVFCRAFCMDTDGLGTHSDQARDYHEQR